MSNAASILRPRRDSGRSRWVAVLGILALCLQILTPGLGSAQAGDWMVICADGGEQRVQIDLATGTPVEDQPCPDCDSCRFCAAGVDLGLAPVCGKTDAGFLVAQIDALPPSHVTRKTRNLWPSTRGPPAAGLVGIPDTNSDRAFRAISALNLKMEGAL
ncbi:hypothetical protein J7443_22085 [Tropicibacter sp. R15_0]|uniref:hypothetical protein n=1 Tax=Tropicibacter sp. R15_0 TaxID=2821101 RepID=UPI001ADC1CB9|nr:hypothetical protein [Tropicibacter sp. R15_0]MBO9467937.1 hypothetical protein [Tropicibacter sp. R15_0]